MRRGSTSRLPSRTLPPSFPLSLLYSLRCFQHHSKIRTKINVALARSPALHHCRQPHHRSCCIVCCCPQASVPALTLPVCLCLPPKSVAVLCAYLRRGRRTRVSLHAHARSLLQHSWLRRRAELACRCHALRLMPCPPLAFVFVASTHSAAYCLTFALGFESNAWLAAKAGIKL